MLFGVGVSCRSLYSFVGYLYEFILIGSESITSVWEERELICLLLFTCLRAVEDVLKPPGSLLATDRS